MGLFVNIEFSTLTQATFDKFSFIKLTSISLKEISVKDCFRNEVLPEVERIRPSLAVKKKGVKSPTKNTIEEIYKKEGFIKFAKGIVHAETFKELTLKNGEKSFLLKLVLSDDTASIKVNIWGMRAVEAVKIFNDGVGVKLTNVFIKENSYSNEKELSFTKNSRLELL